MVKHQQPSLLSRLLPGFGGKAARIDRTDAKLRPFQAISIYRGVTACPMARKFSEHRFLAKDAPQLPLTGCALRETCECVYLKHKDRRAEPRRLVDFGTSAHLLKSGHKGEERRMRTHRRSID